MENHRVLKILLFFVSRFRIHCELELCAYFASLGDRETVP